MLHYRIHHTQSQAALKVRDLILQLYNMPTTPARIYARANMRHGPGRKIFRTRIFILPIHDLIFTLMIQAYRILYRVNVVKFVKFVIS